MGRDPNVGVGLGLGWKKDCWDSVVVGLRFKLGLGLGFEGRDGGGES